MSENVTPLFPNLPGPVSSSTPRKLTPKATIERSGNAHELTDPQLIALILGANPHQPHAGDQAARALESLGGIHSLRELAIEEVLELKNVGAARACVLLAAVELASRLNTPKEDRPVVSSPADTDALLRSRIAHQDREHFITVLLNTKNRVLRAPTISIGTLSSSPIHPRDVFRPAIKCGAASVIVAHNHPSGDTTPSREDRDVTKRLVDSGNTLGIEVLDHIIIGSPGYFSMKEAGHI